MKANHQGQKVPVMRDTEPEAVYSDIPTGEEELAARVAGFAKTPLQFYSQQVVNVKM